MSRPSWIPEPPPNLRKGDDSKECEICTHYQDGECARYLYRTDDGTARLPVDEDWVCDGYAPSGRTDLDDQPTSLAEARIRVKAHFRRRREQQ